MEEAFVLCEVLSCPSEQQKMEEEEEPVLIKGNRGRKMASKRMMIKEPRMMIKEPRVMIKRPEPPVYMSLEEVGKRSKMFEREQREKRERCRKQDIATRGEGAREAEGGRHRAPGAEGGGETESDKDAKKKKG